MLKHQNKVLPRHTTLFDVNKCITLAHKCVFKVSLAVTNDFKTLAREILTSNPESGVQG